MIRRGAQILAQGQHIDLRRAQIRQGVANFHIRLAQSQHQAGFREHVGFIDFRRAQYLDALLVPCARIAHRMSQAPHGFHILREHVQS
jgi:hypothetical protein